MDGWMDGWILDGERVGKKDGSRRTKRMKDDDDDRNRN
jgi:hypothetical protein